LNPPDLGWGNLKKKDREPTFAEPWHAQALAMADLLVKSGKISGSRWAETLGSEISAAKAAGEPDDGETFFLAALSALERVLAEDGSVTPPELARRQQEWERAYLRTPHGQPVQLGRGEGPDRAEPYRPS